MLVALKPLFFWEHQRSKALKYVHVLVRGLGPVHVHGSRTKPEQCEGQRSSEGQHGGQHKFTWETHQHQQQKCLAHWHMHQCSESRLLCSIFRIIGSENLFQLFLKQKKEL